MRAEPDVRAMADMLPVPFYGTDAAGWITCFNEAAVVLWGRRPILGEERWCGAMHGYLPNGEPLPLEHTALPRALRAQTSKISDGYIERPDDTRLFCRADVRLIRDSAGQVLGAVNVTIDLTSNELPQARRVSEPEATHISLSPRQRQVYQGIIAGQSTNAIARALGTSTRTVQVYRRIIMAKLHVSSVAELASVPLEAAP